MKKIPDNVINFLQDQGFVIVSTIDENGLPHNSCKGLVDIDKSGNIYILDVYKGKTHENLKRNSALSITSVDEHRFVGFSLKGKGRVISREEVSPQIIKAWEDKVTSRLTRRLLKNLHEEKGHPKHPEALLPQPEYLITMKTEEIIDLTPQHLK